MGESTSKEYNYLMGLLDDAKYDASDEESELIHSIRFKLIVS